MGGLATTALSWWDSMVQEANAKYQIWLAASPLERLNALYPDEQVYNTSAARQRMELRSSAPSMAALATSLREGSWWRRGILQAVAFCSELCRRNYVGRAYKIEMAARDPREAVEKLTHWKRHQQRAEELKVTLPYNTLLVKSLSTLVGHVLPQAPQANFRVNAYRMQSRVDINPSQATMQEFYTLLLAEMETGSST